METYTKHYDLTITWPMWTAERTKDLTPRCLQQVTMPLPHLTYKTDLLKAFKEFGVFKARVTHLLECSCNKPFSAPNSSVSVSFGLTVHWVHRLGFGDNPNLLEDKLIVSQGNSRFGKQTPRWRLACREQYLGKKKEAEMSWDVLNIIRNQSHVVLWSSGDLSESL